MENELFNKVTELIPSNERDIFLAIHDNAVSAGFTPFVTKSEKRNFGKIEYKRTKKGDLLFAVQINSPQWSLRCKLFNLDKYTELLNNLNESVLRRLLESRKCKGVGNGCTVGIKFEYDNQKYNLCRHLIRLRDVCQADVPSIWSLLQAESEFR